MASFQLISIDPMAEMIKFAAEFYLDWKDPILRWNKTQFNVSSLLIREDYVWKPDVMISSSLGGSITLDANKRYLKVQSNGRIRQSMRGVFLNDCRIKTELFPYDTQMCEIYIGPWTYSREQVSTSVQEPQLGQYYKGNSAFELYNVTGSVDATQYGYYEDYEVYEEALFRVYFRRRAELYYWGLIIPSFIISVTSIFGLFIPSTTLFERRERVTLGICTLLANTVILQTLAGLLPKSGVIPLIGDFVIAETIINAIAILVSVIVLLLQNRAIRMKWKMPWWIKWAIKYPSCCLSKKPKHQPRSSTTVVQDETLSPILQKICACLTTIDHWINEKHREKKLECRWTRFFDRIDMLILICFQLGNILLIIKIVY